MPSLKNHTVLSIARGVKAFLNLEAGIVRSGEPGREPGQKAPARRKPSAAGAKLNARPHGVRPENMVWIFGYGGGRSGTTWLSGMLRRLNGNTLWSSPRVGDLFGFLDYKFMSEVSGADRDRDEHILGHGQRELWLKSVRLFVLDQAAARYPKLTRPGEKRLIINDIHGSIGAPIIMDALPESRMILMMRDPRDMMASIIDGLKRGSWSHEELKKVAGDDSANGASEPSIRERAANISQGMENARRAYRNHKGPKAILKYEDLREDAMAAMKNLHADLGLTVDDEELAQIVEKDSWENIPSDQKGEGKFYRKAAPGSWREDLTPEQKETIEEIFAPVLDEFYPEV